MTLPAPADKGPISMLATSPADGAEAVPIAAIVSVLFDKRVDPDSGIEPGDGPYGGARFRVVDASGRPVPGSIEPILSDDSNPDGTPVEAGFRFTPDRRLRYGETYSVVIDKIRGLAGQEVSDETAFTTFAPAFLGLVELEAPSDIAVLSPGRIAVANGGANMAPDLASTLGAVLIDVADPSSPELIDQKPISGDTLGIAAADAATVATVSGGLDVIGRMDVLTVEADGFTSAGSALLCMDSTSLAMGNTLSRVPPYAGIPRRVAVAGDNIYAASIGISVEMISLAEAKTRLGAGDLNPDIGLRAGSPICVAALVRDGEDVVLSGDMRELELLDLNGDPLASIDVPPHDIETAAGFPVVEDDARDLAFIAGHDTGLYIVEVGPDADEKLTILSRIELDAYPSDVAVSPERRLAYLPTGGSVLIIDLSDALTGTDLIDENDDNIDDRILGEIEGFTRARSVAVDDCTFYVGDDQGHQIHTLSLDNSTDCGAVPECDLERIGIEDDAYPIVSEPVKAVAYPKNVPVTWEIVSHHPEPLDVTIDPITGVITPGPIVNNGWIEVRAKAVGQPTCSVSAWVPIGCCTCTLDSKLCESQPGAGDATLSSIDFKMSVGLSSNGKSAGYLFLRGEAPDPSLASPSALEFSTLAPDVEILRDDGVLRQILAPNSFVDIAETATGMTVDVYHPEAAGDPDADGFYTVAAGNTPFTTWTVEHSAAESSLTISETRGGEVRANTYETAPGGLRLTKGGGIQVRTRTEGTTADGRTVTETTANDAGAVASKVKTTYRSFSFGERITEETRYTGDGQAPLTTSRNYFNDESSNGYGRIKRITRPTGDWTQYVYDGDGRVIKETRLWLDGPTTKVTEYDYTPVDPVDANAPIDHSKPRTITEKVGGIVISKTYNVYLVDPGTGERTEITERCAEVTAGYGNASNLRTIRTYFASGTGLEAEGRLKSVVYPDGRMDNYAYETGTFDPAADAFTPGPGTDVRETVIHGTVDSPDGVPGKTTREMRIENDFGTRLFSENYVYTEDGDNIRVSWTKSDIIDDFGRIVREIRSDGTVREAAWSCCNKESETGPDGVTVTYDHDALNRVKTMVKEGLNGPVTTSYTYDAAGRQLTQTVTAGALSLTTSTEYDQAGRILSSVDQAGLETRYTYENNGRTTTVTRPGGAKETTDQYADGRTRTVSGSAVTPRYYAYGVDPDGTQWTKVYAGTMDDASPMWETSFTDALGRTIRTEKPGFGGTVEIAQSFYDADGRLIRSTAPGQAVTLFEYDELGNQTRSGLDIDGNGALDLASDDRITDADARFASIDGVLWQESVQSVYAESGDPTETVVSTNRTRLSDLGTPGAHGILTGESVSIDIHGNRTVQRSFLDRDNQSRTRVIDYPDSDIDAVSVSRFGLLISSTGKTGVTHTFQYDDLGRRTGVNDPRTGLSVTHYNEKGQIDWTEDAAGNRTTFTYDKTTGHKIAETNPLGKSTRYAYNLRGQITRTWGEVPYPVEYVYDAHGRMIELHTFRSGTGWNGETWPEGAATPDITRWHYDEATGLLAAKEYADGTQTQYTYEKAGKLDTRIWARTDAGGNPLVTDYDYYPDTGELTLIDYSDATTDISFDYDRLGRQETITDAVGVRTFAYNSALQLKSETIHGGSLYGADTVVLTRTYEDAAGVPGRNSGFTLGAGYAVTYGYGRTGRFETLGWNVDGKSDAVTYSYEANSELLHGYAVDTGVGVTYTYEDKRNLKTQVENTYGVSVISRYDYTYDELGRRVSAVNTGKAFDGAGRTGFNKYGYNDRSEVTASHRYEGMDTGDLSVPVDPEKRLYDYDPIGNREQATEGAAETLYATNELNQYAQLTGAVTAEPVYDLDGNMTKYDGRTYTWNGENRLVAVEPESPVANDKKVTFVYDYMGRRCRKLVSTFSDGSWNQTKEILFVYSGWNMIKETTTPHGGPSIDKHYVWGLDLSQSLQDPFGDRILSMTPMGSGSTSDFAYSEQWKQMLRPHKAEKIGGGSGLGYFGGNYQDYQSEHGLLLALWNVMTGGTKMSLGMFKFAVKAEWIADRTTIQSPIFKQYVSNVTRKIRLRDGTIRDVATGASFSNEINDGPTWQEKRFFSSKEQIKEIWGKEQSHYYLDAPLIGVPECPEGEVQFEATWRIVLTEVKSSGKGDEATAKIKIKFRFDTEEPEKPIESNFQILSPTTINRVTLGN